jgi:hypothetical protein
MSFPVPALLLLLWPIWAQVQDAGVIEVRLQNATPGGATSGSAVTLASMTEAGWRTERVGATDEQGRVTFSDLPLGSGTMYLPIVSHGGAWYYPPQPLDLSDEPHSTVDVTVFDTTRSDEALRYDRSAMLVAGIQPESLAMMEMSALNNTEPRTFVGAEGVDATRAITARFPLPVGALGAQPQAGLIASQVTTTPDGLAMTWPLQPGRHELAFSYQLPYSGNQAIIDRVLAYPVSTLTVYLPDANLQLTSDRQRLRVQISGLAVPAGAGSTNNTSAIVLGAGATVLVAGLGLAFAWRRRAGTSNASKMAERARLIGEIAALDERLAAGLIAEGAHREAREAMLHRVVALTPPTGEQRASVESTRS